MSKEMPVQTVEEPCLVYFVTSAVGSGFTSSVQAGVRVEGLPSASNFCPSSFLLFTTPLPANQKQETIKKTLLCLLMPLPPLLLIPATLPGAGLTEPSLDATGRPHYLPSCSTRGQRTDNLGLKKQREAPVPICCLSQFLVPRGQSAPAVGTRKGATPWG